MKIDIERIKKEKTMKELLEFSIVNINKSSGPTSFQVSEFVKKKLGGTKSSHFGTLDPKVTGVLPVAINRACKLAGYFLGEDKTYVGIMRMHDEIELDKIQEKINEKFLGEIIQMPPVKSRVKRELRPRTIYEFKVLEKDKNDILFRASVQGGTYIRTLCVDLGKELGVDAHMLELRRTKAGIFFEDDEKYPSISLYDFEKRVEEYKEGNEKPLRDVLIPAEIIGTILPAVEIKKSAVKGVLHGSPIHLDEVEDKKVLEMQEGEKFAAFSKGQFIGVFHVKKQKNEFAKAEFTLQPIR